MSKSFSSGSKVLHVQRPAEVSKIIGEGSSGERKTRDGVGGKELSHAELQERSRKGLCFKCGERWGLDHMCKFKHY